MSGNYKNFLCKSFCVHRGSRFITLFYVGGFSILDAARYFMCRHTFRDLSNAPPITSFPPPFRYYRGFHVEVKSVHNRYDGVLHAGRVFETPIQ